MHIPKEPSTRRAPETGEIDMESMHLQTFGWRRKDSGHRGAFVSHFVLRGSATEAAAYSFLFFLHFGGTAVLAPQGAFDSCQLGPKINKFYCTHTRQKAVRLGKKEALWYMAYTHKEK